MMNKLLLFVLLAGCEITEPTRWVDPCRLEVFRDENTSSAIYLTALDSTLVADSVRYYDCGDRRFEGKVVRP